jgi:protein-disulfide isomerase
LVFGFWFLKETLISRKTEDRKPKTKDPKYIFMSEQKKSSLPVAIIGLVLLAAIGGGAWLYSQGGGGKPPIKDKQPGNKTTTALDYNAVPGAEPAWSKGANNAPVVMEEFADLACPQCAKVTPILHEVRSSYGDKVKLIFRQFPLEIPAHKNAYDASRAAEAAGMQGKFWEMENILFKNQTLWQPAADPRPLFEDYAKQIGLNVEQLKTDMVGMPATMRVDADKKRGKALNVASTPSVYLNGKLLGIEDLTPETLKKLIDAELAKGSPAPAAPAANTNSASNK